jgi:hypothetical protein
LPKTNIHMKTTLRNLLALLDDAGIPVTNPRSGIRLYRQTGNWQVWLKVDGKTVHVGYFIDLYSAVIAREEAERLHYPDGRPAPKKSRKKAVSPAIGETVGSTEGDDWDESVLD